MISDYMNDVANGYTGKDFKNQNNEKLVLNLYDKDNYVIQIYLFILVTLPIIIYEVFKINLILVLIINFMIYLLIVLKLKNSVNINNG